MACACAATSSQIGDIVPRGFDWAAVEDNPVLLAGRRQVAELENYMDALRKSGDSVGARVDVVADGVPPGWGEPIYGKLDGDLAAALMCINAVKGVEIGDGFGSGRAAGHRASRRDDARGLPQQPRRRHPRRHLQRPGDHLLGGVQADLQPAPARRARVDVDGEAVEVVTTGRHDPCVGIRATPICEAMMALVLMDQALRHRAQCGDVGAVSPRIPGQRPL